MWSLTISSRKTPGMGVSGALYCVFLWSARTQSVRNIHGNGVAVGWGLTATL